MKTPVIAALAMSVGALGSIAPVAEATPAAHTKPGPHGGGNLYSATCHYLLRRGGGTTSGVSSATRESAAAAQQDARRSAPSDAQITGCSVTRLD
ncbi:MAG: hypothetical protein ACRC20_16305 [Segniliparus sp.]|uniref:hypothetical protein n=1 Tax=Segniliparus sp. TaxID=2804064 RepID=UPI003F3160D2